MDFIAIENSTGGSPFFIKNVADPGEAFVLLARVLGLQDPGDADYDLYECKPTANPNVFEGCAQ